MIELGGADLEDRFWGSPRFIQPVFDKRANREVPPYLSFDDESGADGLWRGFLNYSSPASSLFCSGIRCETSLF